MRDEYNFSKSQRIKILSKNECSSTFSEKIRKMTDEEMA